MAGTGVVMALRPKKGAGIPLIGFLVRQKKDRLAAAQQRKMRLAPLMFADLVWV